LIADANGGSCHQFRWKIRFAGIGGEKTRGRSGDGTGVCG
jgi:hypothetical protein